MNTNNNAKLTSFRALFTDPEIVQLTGGPLDGYLLPGTDAHQSEYLSKHDCRICFFSGFSGSNAFALVTQNKALMWTDGRYFIQAKAQLENGWELMKEGLPCSVSPTEWMIQNLKNGERIAFDPQLYKHSDGLRLMSSLNQAGIKAVPLYRNLVDIIWTNRPSEPLGKVIALKKEECGVEAIDKISEVRKKLSKSACNAAIFCALDDIAWLLNIRGSDIPYNPLVYSIIFITPDQVHLFINQQKLDDELVKHLSFVELHEYKEAKEYIANWLKEHKGSYKVCIPDSTNYELGSLVERENGIDMPSIIQPMKAMKNEVELSGMRNSSIRDSAAIVEFLVWLNDQIESGKEIAEMEACDKMDQIRSQQERYISPSFDTIGAVDEHAALPHYRATNVTGKQLVTKKSVFLIDSGGQYRDGTTDVTRTVAFSENNDNEFKRMFTLVLKGHIANALLKFPAGVNGIRMDAIARQYLWADGFNFEHGVGHGVGHFLNVHEGPVGISFRRYDKDGGIFKGMVLTIEPGFYVENKWGIRIENCYEIIEATNLRSKTTDYLTFRPLTLVPIQKSLIDKSLLTDVEIDWIDNYHEQCQKTIGAFLLAHEKRKEYEWLTNACGPL